MAGGLAGVVGDDLTKVVRRPQGGRDEQPGLDEVGEVGEAVELPDSLDGVGGGLDAIPSRREEQRLGSSHAATAVAICRSDTRSNRSAGAITATTASVIATRTASPSAIVAHWPHSTGRRASQESFITGAPFATTPTRSARVPIARP